MRNGPITATALAGGLLLLGDAAHAQSTNKFPAKICDVREYGAGGTRIWFDTEAFQKAIDACARGRRVTTSRPILANAEKA